MKQQIPFDIETGAIALCALRYCVGRRTYMPSLVIEWVKRHWHEIAANDHITIKEEIAEVISKNMFLGDDCDIQTWHSFYEWLQQN